MITLACAKCGATLEVDDGFAGGTCRCATCGTIQTVPPRGDASATRGAFGSCKPIFERSGDVAIASTVPRGGMQRSADEPRPRAARASRPPPRPGPIRRAWPAVMLVAVTGAVAVAMAILLWKRVERVAEIAPTSTEPLVTASTRRAPPPLTDGPRFGAIRLSGAGPIVYLIDRDAATRPFAEGIRRAVLASIDTLPPGRLAQVRLYSDRSESPAYPERPGPMTTELKAGLLRWMDGVPEAASTDAAASLSAALAGPVDEIVLVTGHGWQADDRLAEEALELLRDRRAKVHTVSLGTSEVRGPMAKIAASTGGESIALTIADLAGLTASGR